MSHPLILILVKEKKKKKGSESRQPRHWSFSLLITIRVRASAHSAPEKWKGEEHIPDPEDKTVTEQCVYKPNLLPVGEMLCYREVRCAPTCGGNTFFAYDHLSRKDGNQRHFILQRKHALYAIYDFKFINPNTHTHIYVNIYLHPADQYSFHYPRFPSWSKISNQHVHH